MPEEIKSPPADTAAESATAGNGNLMDTFGQAPSFAMVLLIAGLLAASCAIAGYLLNRDLTSRIPKFGTVDIADVVQAKQLAVARTALRADATEAQKAKTNQEIQKFGPELEAVLAQTQAECGCVLLVRSAVVTGSAQDYTDGVKKKLGLEKISARDLEELVKFGRKDEPDAVTKPSGVPKK